MTENGSQISTYIVEWSLASVVHEMLLGATLLDKYEREINGGQAAIEAPKLNSITSRLV